MFTGQNLLWNSYWTPLDPTGLVRISALSFGGNPLIHWVYTFPDTTPAGQCYTKRVKSKNRTWGFMKDCRGTHMKNSSHTKWHHRFHLCLAALHESFQLLDSAGLTKGFGSNTWSAMLSSQLDASLLPKKGWWVKTAPICLEKGRLMKNSSPGRQLIPQPAAVSCSSHHKKTDKAFRECCDAKGGKHRASEKDYWLTSKDLICDIYPQA